MEPRERAHHAFLYEDDTELVDAVARFFESGIQAGHPGIGVLTSDHAEALRRRMPSRALANVEILEAHSTLELLTRAGEPDADLFEGTIGHLVRRRRAEAPGLRVFGEMVNLLMLNDRAAAAIALERLWNRLAVVTDFELLCAYSKRCFTEPDGGRRLTGVRQEHTRVSA